MSPEFAVLVAIAGSIVPLRKERNTLEMCRKIASKYTAQRIKTEIFGSHQFIDFVSKQEAGARNAQWCRLLGAQWQKIGSDGKRGSEYCQQQGIAKGGRRYSSSEERLAGIVLLGEYNQRKS